MSTTATTIAVSHPEVPRAGVAHAEEGRAARCAPRLPADVVRRLVQKSAWHAWWVIGRDYAVIAAAIVACEAFFHPVLYGLCVIVISARMSSVAGLGHEAAHYNLFRNKRANEWVGLVFCFSVVFFAVTPRAYRRSHLAHHRFTNMPGDPDPAIQGMPLVESVADAVMFFVRGVTLPVVYFLEGLWRRPWWVQATAVSAVATLVWALPDVARIVALYWVIPLLTGYSVFEFIRLNAEHNGVEADDPLYRTRTVIPTWLSRLTVAPEYVGYHLAHHIYPGVPFFRRKELHYALMEASEEYRANAHLTRGYGRMLLELLRFRGGPLIRSRPAIVPPTETRPSEARSTEDGSVAQRSIEHLVPLGRGRLCGRHLGVWPDAMLRGAGFAAQTLDALAYPPVAAATDEVLAALGNRPLSAIDESARAFVGERLEAGMRDASKRLRELARDERLREAVIWQNRRVLHTGFDSLAAKPPEVRNKKTKAKEVMVASYLQRYCVKNDTIGFFGPVGLAEVRAGDRWISLELGEGLVEQRRVYFEQWCIDALARALAANEALRRWAPARLAPYCRVEAGKLHIPFMPPLDLEPAQEALLRRLDGVTPVCVLVDELAAPSSAALDPDEAYAYLHRAAALDVVGWDFAGPLELHPERTLRERLGRIGEPSLRAQAIAQLDRLEAGRDRVAAAAGDSGALDRAMAELEADFIELSGQSPTRADGKVYAARTLLYEDCRRDARLVIGSKLLDRLSGPIHLLAESGRWVRHEVAKSYRALMEELFDRFSVDGQPVPLLELHKALAEAEPALSDVTSGLSPRIAPIQHELQERWSRVLDLPAGERRVRFTSEELRERVEREFAAPGCGWENARYIAPDIMIEADSVEAVERGDCRLVMGELHLSNTLACSVYMAQLRDLDGVRDRTRKDLPERRVVPALPNALWSQRYAYMPTLDEDERYCFGPDPSPASSHRTLNVADLLVERSARGLRVIHRTRDWEIDVIELMGLFLTMLTTNLLQILPKRRHVPRIEIDGVVVVRESWTSPVSELAFVRAKDPVDRWLGAQAWRRSVGIPRRAFVKVPVEPKPCFVDFDSPIYVEKLIRFLRVTAEADPKHTVSLSEMVPGPDELWLRDREGNRYTSELRLVLVDRRPA